MIFLVTSLFPILLCTIISSFESVQEVAVIHWRFLIYLVPLITFSVIFEIKSYNV